MRTSIQPVGFFVTKISCLLNTPSLEALLGRFNSGRRLLLLRKQKDSDAYLLAKVDVDNHIFMIENLRSRVIVTMGR